MVRTIALVCALMAVSGSAVAQAPSLQSLTEGGRYALLELNDQVVRLDTDSGVFSVCQMESEVWSCTLTIDERQVLEERISGLTRRIDELEAALATPASRSKPTASETGGEQGPPPQLVQPPEQPPMATPTAETPAIVEEFAVPEAPEADKPGLLRRLTSALPFVD